MKSAFSLVELSIVLVILGLLTGGILTGQNLIRASELRNVSIEFPRIITASYTFREKYLDLPGDLPNATDFWGAADSSGPGGECANPTTDVGTGTQICNGNGDGRVSFVNNTPLDFYERFTYWEHLANAGLISGKYTGTWSGASFVDVSPGENVPEFAVDNTCAYIGTTVPADPTFDSFVGYLYMVIGGANSIACSGGFLTPEEAWNIDKKLDDGKLGSGKVGSKSNTEDSNCSSSDDPDTSEYVLDSDEKACYIGAILWRQSSP